MTVWRDGQPLPAPARYDCLHIERTALDVQRDGLAEFRLEAPGALDACLIELQPRRG